MYQIQPAQLQALEQRELELAVVIPVLNEHANVEPLLHQLSLALASIEWEVLFVDDGSKDGTAELIERLARRDRRIRLIRRHSRRGLSSAVVEGFLASVAPVLAVIDGDMQHDEQLLPILYEAIAQRGFDLAVGTRYSGNGGIGEWSRKRAKFSRFATGLAKPLLRTSLTDPMSGFFALRRDVLTAAVPHLSTVGYKILLDIVASSPKALNAIELPYMFRDRVAGTSKLDSMIALEYIELLLDKLVGRFVPVKLVLFGLIGMVGAVVHMAVFGLLTMLAGATFSLAQSVAVLISMIGNYALNNHLTYRDRRLTGWRWLSGLARFALACSIGAIANVGVGSAIYAASNGSLWLGAAAGIAVGSVWNYVATRWLTWRRR